MALPVGPPLQSFAAENGIRWPQVLLADTSGVVRDYAVGGYPATFLIDPGGMIVSNLRLSGADAYRTVAAALGDTASMMSFIAGGNQKFRFAGEMRGSVEVEGRLADRLARLAAASSLLERFGIRPRRHALPRSLSLPVHR